MDKLHQNCLQLCLAELYHNGRAVDAIKETLRKKQHAASAKSDELVGWEKTVKALKKEHGRLTREQQHMEKEI